MNEPRNGLFVEYCAKDFLDGTLSLDVWEELAYRRLVDMIYATNDKVKDDDKKLAWATKAGSRWPKIKTALIEAGKIEAIDGRITNARCRKELEKSAKKIEQKRIAGKASADARKCPENKETTPTAVVTDVATAGPTAGQLTTNPITQVREEREVSTSLLGKPDRAAKKPRAKPDTKQTDMDFAEWFAQYPLRVDERTAMKQYRTERKAGTSREDLLDGAMRYAAECEGKDPQWIKKPVNWLKAGSWNNKPTLFTSSHGSKNVLQLDLARTYQQQPDIRRRAILSAMPELNGSLDELDGGRAGAF